LLSTILIAHPAELGVSPRRCMYRLGHTNPKFTMAVYQQVLESLIMRIYQQVLEVGDVGVRLDG
jgi:hypothetical protein